MNKRRISWLMAAIAVPALAFGAMASVAFAAPGIDPDRAAELIPAVLIDPSVLPGDGWETKTNDFTDSTTSPDTAACKNSDAKLKALSKGLESKRAARGKVDMTNVAGDLPVLVGSEIEVYQTGTDLQSALKDVRAIFASADYVTCLATIFAKDVPGATAKRVEPFVDTKSSDPAAAFAAEVSAKDLPAPLRIEAYFYVSGNTVALISVLTPNNGLTKSDVEFFASIQALSIDACDCGPQ
jgi:hypothetical protein